MGELLAPVEPPMAAGAVQIYQSLFRPDLRAVGAGEDQAGAHVAVVLRFSEPTECLILTAEMADRIATLTAESRRRNESLGVTGV